jgi:xanthine dehydrogenase YagS FAD-binding subunit
MCVALSALGASVRVRGSRGERTILFNDFHRLPGKSPEIDTNLRPDELILSIDLPKSPYADHFAYIKARDRASYAFALVSAAAALELDGNVVRSARLAMGGVAHKPWRAESAERVLDGKPMSVENFRAAAEEAVKGAQTFEYNAFKVEMAKQTIVRALVVAGGQA